MASTIPIYSANITVSIIKVSKEKTKILDFMMRQAVVKGFTPVDIVDRCQSKLFDKFSSIESLPKSDFFHYYQIDKIELLMQHGYGLNEN